MKKIIKNNPTSLWLIDAADRVGVQKINRLPDTEPLHQIGKLAVAMGMGKIQLKPATAYIGKIDLTGCMVSCKGFDIVPFVSGIYPDDTLQDAEFDLGSPYEVEPKKDDEYN